LADYAGRTGIWTRGAGTLVPASEFSGSSAGWQAIGDSQFGFGGAVKNPGGAGSFFGRPVPGYRYEMPSPRGWSVPSVAYRAPQRFAWERYAARGMWFLGLTQILYELDPLHLKQWAVTGTAGTPGYQADAAGWQLSGDGPSNADGTTGAPDRPYHYVQFSPGSGGYPHPFSISCGYAIFQPGPGVTAGVAVPAGTDTIIEFWSASSNPAFGGIKTRALTKYSAGGSPPDPSYSTGGVQYTLPMKPIFYPKDEPGFSTSPATERSKVDADGRYVSRPSVRPGLEYVWPPFVAPQPRTRPVEGDFGLPGGPGGRSRWPRPRGLPGTLPSRVRPVVHIDRPDRSIKGLPRGFMAVLKLFHAATELCDAMQAMRKALPKVRVHRSRLGRGIDPGGGGCGADIMAVARNWDAFFDAEVFQRMVENLIENEVQDRIIGTLNSRKFPGLPDGKFQIGKGKIVGWKPAVPTQTVGVHRNY